MKDADLRSALAESIRRFVEYKRALNRRYRPEAAALRLFDRYLYENNITEWDGIDSISTERFLQSRPRTRPRSYNHLLGVLHRFFDWAVVQRLVANNPVTAARHRDTGKRIPYIFNLSDAKRLQEVVDALPDRSRAPHRAQTYKTIFALLYGLGLRVGEAVRLKLGDVDFQRDTLFIRETKFNKNRIVPFGPKLAFAFAVTWTNAMARRLKPNDRCSRLPNVAVYAQKPSVKHSTHSFPSSVCTCRRAFLRPDFMTFDTPLPLAPCCAGIARASTRTAV